MRSSQYPLACFILLSLRVSTNRSDADCMAIARKRNEVCLGIKIGALESDSEANYGVNLIPEKNTKLTLKSDDSLVVVSEDET